jgi:hypothetical protein
VREWVLAAALVACGARTPLATGGKAPVDAGSHDAGADTDAADADAATTLCGGPGGAELAATGPHPDTIVVDGGFVYWHDAEGISRVPIGGGAVQPVAKVAAQLFPDLSAFAVGGGFVFYGDGAAIERAPVAGGGPTPIAPVLPLPGFAASKSFVRVWRRNGPTTYPILRLDFASGQVLGVDDLPEKPNEMFFVGEDAWVAADPGVYRIPFGSPPQILSGQTASDIAVDADTIYFTSSDATNGARVVVLSKQTLKASDLPDTFGAFAIAMDDADLFFTDGNGLRVRRIDGKTGPVEDVASDGPDFAPVDLALAGACVFWTSSSRSGATSPGKVMVAPKHD